MLAQCESSPARNLAYAKAYARKRYPNDERLYLAFVAGAAFSEGMRFWHCQGSLANDSEEPEDENIIFRQTKRKKTIAINTKTHQIFGIGQEPPLDLAALKKAENSVDPDITDEAAEDEHKRIVAAKRFWGERHEGPKGMGAINFLLNKGSGYVPAAWHREDAGDIDLCWGDSRAGLKHIIIRRKKTGQNLISVVKAMNQILLQGKRSPKEERNGGIVLRKGSARVVLSRLQGEKNRYVVTAFEKS